MGERRKTYQGEPLTFRESLHLCGCPGCMEEIRQRVASEPPMKPDFVAYLRETYPATAHLLDGFQ